MRRRLSLPLAAIGLLLLPVEAGAQLSVDSSVLPSGANNSSSTENVDFGDVDLDGDWDVVMADGGDDGNDQNRIWINLGGLQGGTLGVFDDQTATRFPSVSDDSRDIEFVDFDGDSDLDVYVSNTAQLSNQGNRWWTNSGGSQGGTTGFYVDETSSRWVNLGGAGSSIDPSELIAGTFIDWSCDCDFGDLDNDGDMDLVHSSYGGTFGGQVPTRIFLNDGSGHFEEFNPSGFQLSGPTIANGNPGLWCEGVQTANTTDSTGAQCDVASTALDIDVGDIDGDFDLDILHGARNEDPRMFVNRLDGSSLAPAAPGGMPLFRDVTGAVFPAGYSTGMFGHYEQEMGDFDGDGDLDIYGLNWHRSGFVFTDVVLTNQGDGTYGNLTELPGSNDDDNEGDFFDVENDGDLDLYVANFSGFDRLYLNDGVGNYSLGSLPGFFRVDLDADIADTDGDGDYDVLIAADDFASNVFLRNVSQIPDTHPPYIPNVEDLSGRLGQPGPHVVRAHVYDNAPYYITWYNRTWVQLSVDGCRLPDIPARSSGGQVFRAELPGGITGNAWYRFVSEDAYGNRGFSAKVVRTTSRVQKAPRTPGDGGGRAPLVGDATPGPAGTPQLVPLTRADAGSAPFLAARYPVGGVPFLLVTSDARGPQRDLGCVRTSLAGRIVAVSGGVIRSEGATAVRLPRIPPDLKAGSRLWAQLFVRDGTRWAASAALEIASH